MLWKQPMVGDLAIHLVPHLSGGGLERAPDATAVQPGSTTTTSTTATARVDTRSSATDSDAAATTAPAIVKAHGITGP